MYRVYSTRVAWLVSLTLFLGNSGSGGDGQTETDKSKSVQKISQSVVIPAGKLRVPRVAVSRDGKLLATTLESSAILIWDTTEAKELHRLVGHTDAVESLDFSSDGSSLVSASRDRSIRIWEVQTGRESNKFLGHDKAVMAVRFTPRGDQLLSGSEDQTLRLWSIPKAREIRRFEGHVDEILSLDLSADGRQAISTGLDRTIRLWDIASGKEITKAVDEDFRVSPVGSRVKSISLSPDGRNLAVVTEGGVKEPDIKPIVVRLGTAGIVPHVASISRTGRFIATANSEKKVAAAKLISRELKLADNPQDVLQVLATPIPGTAIVLSVTDDSKDQPSGEVFQFPKQQSKVQCVAMAPDGTLAAAGCEDGTLRVWSVTDRKLVHQLKGHTDWIECVAFSPDGTTLASGSDDKTIRLWNLESGKETLSLAADTAVMCLKVTPDGKRLVSGGDDHQLHSWDLLTGKKLNGFVGHKAGVLALDISADGRQVISTGHDGNIMFWDLVSGQELASGNIGFRVTGTAVSFSPSDPASVVVSTSNGQSQFFKIQYYQNTGKYLLSAKQKLGENKGVLYTSRFLPGARFLAVGDEHGVLRILDAIDGSVVSVLKGHTGILRNLAVSNDGRNILTAGYDGTTRFWRLPTRLVSNRLQVRRVTAKSTAVDLKGHAQFISAVASSPTGNHVAASDHNGLILLWDTATGREIGRFDSKTPGITSLCFLRDGRLVFGTLAGVVEVWDSSAGKLLHRLEGHSDRISGLSASLDGQLIASIAGNIGFLWDSKTGKQSGRIDRYFDGRATRVTFCPTDNSLACSWSDGMVTMHPVVPSGSSFRIGRARELPLYKTAATTVHFFPNGRQFLVSNANGLIQLMDSSSGEIVHSLKGHKDTVTTVAVPQDGRSIQSIDRQGKLRVWDVSDATPETSLRLWDGQEGRLLFKLIGHRGSISSAAFSPDEKLLATGGEDHAVHLWNVATGKKLASLSGHQGEITRLVFSDDSRQVLSCSLDKTLRLWDVDSRQSRGELSGHAGGVIDAVFIPGEPLAVSLGLDNSLILWDILNFKGLTSQPLSEPGIRLGRLDEASSVAVALKTGEMTVFQVVGSGDGFSKQPLTGPPNRRLLGIQMDVSDTRKTEVLVKKVFPGTPAEAAGIQAGDVILEFGGQAVRRASLSQATAGKPFNTPLPVKISRAGKFLTKQLTFRPLLRFKNYSFYSRLSYLVLKGPTHTEDTTDIAFSPDGRFIYSVVDNAGVRGREILEGRFLPTLKGHEGPIRKLSASRDGRWLLSISDDGTARKWPTPQSFRSDRLAIWDFPGRQQRLELKSHSGSLRCVQVSPDSQIVAAGGDDSVIRLWDTGNGKLVREFSGHSGPVTSLAFTPDGSSLLSGSHDKTLRLWRVADGRQLQRFDGSESGVTTVAISADGRLAASGGFDQWLRIWDIESGIQLTREDRVPGALTSVAFANATLQADTGPAGNVGRTPSERKQVIATILTGGISGETNLHEVNFRDNSFGRKSHVERVSALQFANNGSEVFSCGWDGAIVKSRLEAGASPTFNTLRESWSNQLSQRAFLCIRKSHDGKKMAVAGRDSTIKVWTIADGKTLFNFEIHGSSIWSLEFSHDDQALAAGSRDGRVLVWDLETGKQLHELHGQGAVITALGFSPDTKQLLSADEKGAAIAWDLVSGKPVSRTSVASSRLTSIAIGPQTRQIATATQDGSIILWSLNGQGKPPVSTKLGRHDGRVWDMDFSADGRQLVSGGTDRAVMLWDLDRQSRRAVYHDPTSEVWAVAFSSDSQRIALGRDDGWIQIWTPAETKFSMNDPRSKVTATESRAAVRSATFTTDGRFLISSGDDGQVRVADVRSGQKNSPRQVGSRVSRLELAPDGRQILAACQDGMIRVMPTPRSTARHDRNTIRTSRIPLVVDWAKTGRHAVTGHLDGSIRFWSLPDGTVVRHLRPHQGVVYAATLSSNGRFVASAGDDQVVRLTDMVSGRLVAEFHGHTESIRHLQLFADSHRLASSAADGSTRVWKISPETAGDMVADWNGGPAVRVADQENSAATNRLSTFDLDFRRDGRPLSHQQEGAIRRVAEGLQMGAGGTVSRRVTAGLKMNVTADLHMPLNNAAMAGAEVAFRFIFNDGDEMAVVLRQTKAGNQLSHELLVMDDEDMRAGRSNLVAISEKRGSSALASDRQGRPMSSSEQLGNGENREISFHIDQNGAFESRRYTLSKLADSAAFCRCRSCSFPHRDKHLRHWAQISRYERATGFLFGIPEIPGAIGVVLAIKQGKLFITHVVPGSPADKVKLKPGDSITGIGLGKSLKGLTLAKAADRLEGKIGSQVNISVLRDNAEKPEDLVLTRQPIERSLECDNCGTVSAIVSLSPTDTAGIGAIVDSTNGHVVIQILPGGAADIDGRLRQGDRILRVGESADLMVDARQLSTGGLLSHLRGAENTRVHLHVRSGSDGNERKLVLNRLTLSSNWSGISLFPKPTNGYPLVGWKRIGAFVGNSGFPSRPIARAQQVLEPLHASGLRGVAGLDIALLLDDKETRIAQIVPGGVAAQYGKLNVGDTLLGIEEVKLLGVSFSSDGKGPIVVTNVVADSVAEVAGIKVGDVIEEFNGKAVAADSGLDVASAPFDTPVTVKVRRDGQVLAKQAVFRNAIRPIHEIPLEEVVELLYGEPGSRVRLKVRSAASDQVADHLLTRQLIEYTPGVYNDGPMSRRKWDRYSSITNGDTLLGIAQSADGPMVDLRGISVARITHSMLSGPTGTSVFLKVLPTGKKLPVIYEAVRDPGHRRQRVIFRQKLQVSDGLSGKWDIRFNHGLITIERAGETVATCFVPIRKKKRDKWHESSGLRTSQIGRFSVSTRQGTVVLRSISGNGIPTRPPLNLLEHSIADGLFRGLEVDSSLTSNFLGLGAFATLETVRLLFGKEHIDYAIVQHQIGHLQLKTGDVTAARESFEGALAIARKQLGPDHPLTAEFQTDLGAFLTEIGDAQNAQTLLVAARTVIEKVFGGKSPQFARVSNRLGDAFFQSGEPVLARKCLIDVLENHGFSVKGNKVSPPRFRVSHPLPQDVADTLGVLGQNADQRQLAVARLNLAFQISRRAKGGSDRQTWIRYIDLGLAQTDKSEQQRVADQAVRLADIQIRDKADDSVETIALLHRLGQLQLSAWSAKEIEQKKQLHAKSLKEIEQFEKSVLKILTDEEKNKFQNLRYLGARLRVLAAKVPDQLSQEEYDRYRSLKVDLEPGRRVRTASEILDVALERQLRRTSKVLRTTSEAESVLAAQTTNLIHADLLAALWRTHQSNPKNSQSAYRATLKSRRVATRVMMSRRQQNKRSQQVQELTQQLQSVRSQLASRTLPTSLGLDAGKESLRQLNARKESMERLLALEMQQQSRVLRERSVTLEEITDVLPDDATLVDFVVVPSLEESEKSDSRDLLAFIIHKNATSGKPDVKWVRLGDADRILEFVTAWRESMLVWAGERGLSIVKQPAGEKKQENIDTNYTTASARVRELIWNPLEPELGERRTVLIVPDAGMSRIPWSALPGRKPGTFLLEDYAIATVPYPQILQRFSTTSRETEPGDLLLVGGVRYGRREAAAPKDAKQAPPKSATGNRIKWSFLPGTKAEVDAINKLWKDGTVTLLDGVAATEVQVRKELPAARFVHLATHGFFADPSVGSDLDRRSSRGQPSRNPLSLTGVVLAEANDAGSAQQTIGADGIMYAEEVVDLSMSRTELVVLSACETGLGEVAAGEGAFGLQRAFALAGADSVIASLWKVDDAATNTLMSEFYRNLWDRKMGKLAALREAQLTMIRSYDPKKQSLSGNRGLKITRKKNSPDKKDGAGTSERLPPFFWAAFILSGEWR